MSDRVCRWWNFHQWGKWEYYTEKWIRRYEHTPRNMIKEFRKRTCKCCGKKQEQFVTEWYVEGYGN